MEVGPCGGVGLTFHMPAYPLWLLSRTTSPCLCTVIVVAVNVDVQPSAHSFSMNISAPDWRWGKMRAILSLVDSKGLRLSSDLWVACMRLPFERINCGPCEAFTFLLQVVYTLM